MADHDPDGGEAAAVEGAPFRDAMSRLSQQVHVVTTAGPAGTCGITISAVASVSDAPPTLLFCLNRASQRHAVVVRNGVFCINALGAHHTVLADAFAGRVGGEEEDPFAGGQWERRTSGAPVLVDALATFDCKIVKVVDVATHSVIFGEVVGLGMGPLEPALVHRNRAYEEV